MSTGTTTSSSTATATSTATDLRPVIAAAAAAASISSQDEHSSILSGSTILGGLLSAIGLWAIGVGIYRFIKRKRIHRSSPMRSPHSTKNPMFNPSHPLPPTMSPIIRSKSNSISAMNAIPAIQEQKPAILSISANKNIISGILHAPIYVQPIQLRPQLMTSMNLHERRDFQVFQATTVRTMRAGSRLKQIKREE
jgi:hypothetical protein